MDRGKTPVAEGSAAGGPDQAPHVSVQVAGDATWWGRHRGDLGREALVGAMLACLAFGGAVWWDSRLADRQERLEDHRTLHQESLENTRFVRQVWADDLGVRPFRGLNLFGASLAGIQLTCESQGAKNCADFSGALLSDADLSDADLSGASLSEAILTNAKLIRINLAASDLSFADLRGVDLGSANLVGADLSGVDLTDANLADANLTGANLTAASLLDANLSNANLTGANLRAADMQGASLQDADLSDAEVTLVDLSDVEFLTDAQVAGMRWDPDFPPLGLRPSKSS